MEDNPAQTVLQREFAFLEAIEVPAVPLLPLAPIKSKVLGRGLTGEMVPAVRQQNAVDID
jgi:hypothetical protein